MMSVPVRGRLIVLEGGDGVGKTTQLPLVAAALRSHGVAVRTVREPGETVVGQRIRELLLDDSARTVPNTEALLFLAARAQLVAEILRPALDAGEWIVADRFFVSTYSYQIAGHTLSAEGIRAANTLATGGVVPDLTLLLTLPTAVAASRRAARGAPDRLERFGAGFEGRVAAAYEATATAAWQAEHPECGPIVTVSADGTAATVTARLVETILEHMGALR
jgi:dTMP kinase